MSEENPRRVVVVGGGVAGLAAAYQLARARREGAPVEEFLFEAAPRLGGVVQTELVHGCVVEAGPDSFLAEKPEAAAFAREMGLGDELIGSNDRERRTYILHRGDLVPLPEGLMLLIPTRIWPMLTTPLLPLSVKLRFGAEFFRRRPGLNASRDESVAEFVRRHFGAGMLDHIADPLLSGVYGGDSETLSIRSVLPRFWQMEQQYGSLTRAALGIMRQRRARSATGQPLPLFMTLRRGLATLVEKFAVQLESSRIMLGRRVISVERLSDSAAFRVRLEDGRTLEGDAVIFAMPAHAASRLLESLNARLAELLAGIPYSSAMTVSLGYDARAVETLPPGHGFLVPWREKRRLLACTFVDRKFPDRAPAGKALLRCFLGGSRDPDVLGLSDDEVLALVRRELSEILNLRAEPDFVRIYRWSRAMAQYTVGHEERLSAIRTELDRTPGISLAGNAYSGIGISDCIRTGREAAQRAIGRSERTGAAQPAATVGER